MTRVKICGLKTPEMVEVACEAGAAYVGFVFFPKSPRNLDFATARQLAEIVPAGVCKVALTVDANDAFLDALLADTPIDMLQLHGSESPRRVSEVRRRYGLPVMKAVGVAVESDIANVLRYQLAADQLLIDAKPAEGAELPGGNGLAFDWRILQNRTFDKPWMLAGGLTPENVAAAVRLTGARQVDVSSGVESAPGVKDAGLIRAFIKAARS